MTYSLEGSPELTRKFNRLADSVAGSYLELAVTAGALVVSNEAKINAPVRTGNLRRSIHTQTESVSRTLVIVRVGTNVEYAPYVEFGTRYMHAQPYLRPALDTTKADVRVAIAGTLRQLLRAA